MPNEIQMPKIERAVVWGDLHSPYHDIKAVRCVRKIIKDFEPDLLVDVGDAIDCESVSHWNHKKFLFREGKRLIKEVKSSVDTTLYMTEFAPKKAKKVKLLGNHEHWLNLYIEEHPELEGVKEIDISHYFAELGWQIVPHGRFYTHGKLLFHHGDRTGYMSKHHASQWSQMGKSIVYGHFHSVQRFTHETIKADGIPDRHGAFAIGCLSLLERDWNYNRKINWQQGFAVIYFLPNGYFNVYNIDIINGKAIWDGKLYDGTRNGE